MSDLTSGTAPAPRRDPPAAPRARAPAADAPRDRALHHARAALETLFGPPATRPFVVRYWDGSEEGGAPAGVATPRFTLIVRRPGALRRALLPPSELALVEAYLRDDLDAEGDLGAASLLGDATAAALRSPGAALRAARHLLALPRRDAFPNASPDAPSSRGTERRAPLPAARPRHDRRRDARAVRFHYDVGNDFYALWLDERMQYSCGYFPTGAEDIHAAQRAKLEHVCRKLRLAPGERLLDVGCGWGGLLEHAALRHGVEGVGVTLSEPQAAAARARFAAAGIADRCRVEVRDYRDVAAEGAFDKVVSVGMREHVGCARLPDYFAAVHRVLKPGGLYLDHGIVRGGAAESRGVRAWAARRLWRRDAFIQRHVFPDGELATLGALIRDAERAGLEARDVENLREHYTLTLRHWVRRLEARHAEAAAMVGERTYRVWRLYMAASALGFRTGRITLCQTLYARPADGGLVTLPPTRADLHRPDAG